MIDYGYGAQLSPEIPTQAKEWRNNPEIYKWCRQLEPLRECDHQRWLEKIKTDCTVRMYGIKDNKNNEIGVCGLTSIDQVNQKAEFSMYIQPYYQGGGLGTAALKTLLHHGFTALNLNRIWGETFEGNPALKMFEKVGFTVEGKMRQTYFKNGKYTDSYIISILRSEFPFIL